jgi:hypothetical protein
MSRAKPADELCRLLDDGQVGREVGVEDGVEAQDPQGAVEVPDQVGARRRAEGLADGDPDRGSDLDGDDLVRIGQGLPHLPDRGLLDDRSGRAHLGALPAADAAVRVDQQPRVAAPTHELDGADRADPLAAPAEHAVVVLDVEHRVALVGWLRRHVRVRVALELQVVAGEQRAQLAGLGPQRAGDAGGPVPQGQEGRARVPGAVQARAVHGDHGTVLGRREPVAARADARCPAAGELQVDIAQATAAGRVRRFGTPGRHLGQRAEGGAVDAPEVRGLLDGAVLRNGDPHPTGVHAVVPDEADRDAHSRLAGLRTV